MIGENPLLVALVSSALTIVGMIVRSYLTYRWGIKSQIKVSDYQKRQQVFSQLMGRRFTTTQFYVAKTGSARLLADPAAEGAISIRERIAEGFTKKCYNGTG